MTSSDAPWPPEPSPETASLVKRLAGPSTTKAGLAKDQTEINRIIADASKGSKFYENERRKDKDLTERISRVLKQRDEVLRSADVAKVEHDVDRLLVELESTRDLTQIIVHVDMDAFFANVELLYNPELKEKAFGVGYGVLTTASYEARKFGVRSGMPGFIAKKLCPDLIFVSLNPSRYAEMSRRVMDIFRRYDPNMCPAGTDEGYLNITSYCNEHDVNPDKCVQDMRTKVFEETKLTVSAGIAPNKMLAKICSDKNKPNGQFHLPFERKAITTFMQSLSIRKIPGIGRVNERILESIGIKMCGDIYTHRATLSLMDKQFGLMFLLKTYLGMASNVVQPMQRHERKSIGAERTFNAFDDKERILGKLEAVAAELERDMQRTGWVGRTVTLKFKLDTYQVFTRSKSFNHWITNKEDLFATGKELLLPEWPLKLRLIGLRVTKLKDLRAPTTTRGIRQFFESTCASNSREVEEAAEPIDTGNASENPFDFAVHGEDDEVMPGFHEHDEQDVDLDVNAKGINGVDQTLSETRSHVGKHPGPSRIRPPHSAPGPRLLNTSDNSSPSSSALSGPRTSVKPRSTSHTARSSTSSHSLQRSNRDEIHSPSEASTCPICGKTMTTDNQAFNAHVDFCLSRGAIREAQAQAEIAAKRKSSSSNDPDGQQQTLKWDRKSKRHKESHLFT